MSRSLTAQARRVSRLERARGRASPPDPSGARDRSPWDWFADACPCGLAAGECREHPRARPAQRPPEGDWRTWMLLGGRAAGKTRTAAELVRHWAESGQARRIGLVAPTAADYRDTMIQGPSGILAIAPPWNRPRFEPSKRRLTWPNGAIAICLSADQPERARGLQFDRLWCDELCAWPYPQRMWETVLLCLRLGQQPRAVVTTTPKPIKLLARILDDPTTRLSRETTFANARHLAPEFISEITAMYEGTRLGQQELFAEVLDTSETVRFPGFSAARHVMEKAEYVPGLPVRLAIDCGLSRHVGALFFQVRERDGATPGSVRRIISVFADYYAVEQDLVRQRPGHPGAVLSGLRRPHRSRVPRPRQHGQERHRPGRPRRVRPRPGRAAHRLLAGASRPRGPRPGRDPPGCTTAGARLVDSPSMQVPHRELQDLSPGRVEGRDPRRTGRSPAPGRGGDGRPPRGRPDRLPRGADGAGGRHEGLQPQDGEAQPLSGPPIGAGHRTFRPAEAPL